MTGTRMVEWVVVNDHAQVSCVMSPSFHASCHMHVT